MISRSSTLLRLALRRTSPQISGTSTAYSTTSSEDKTDGKWFTLPPFDSAADGPALGRKLAGRRSDSGEESTTALKWVVKCCPQLPRSLIQKLFRLRQVRRESPARPADSDLGIQPHEHQCKRVAAKDVMNIGDRIFLPISVQAVPTTKPKSIHDKGEMDYLRSLELYKDSAIIVVNKPLGMPVQGGAGIRKSLDQLAAAYLKYDFPEAPRLVHRLDRDSSGILVMGRTQTTATILHSIFREKTFGATNDDMNCEKRILQRRYWALVIGSPRRAEGLISAPLKKVIVDDGRSERITVADNALTVSFQHAITEYRVIQSCDQGFTWLELSPLTGRKHQLRVHCAEVLGTPILGDYKYGRIAHKKIKNVTFSNLENDENGEGSVLVKQPCLHLHCKEMVLPDIHKALQHLQLSSECDLSELDNLELTAPLPLHMEKSWNILCPRD